MKIHDLSESCKSNFTAFCSILVLKMGLQ